MSSPRRGSAACGESVVWNNGTNTFNVTAYYKGALAAALGRYEEAEAASVRRSI